MGERTARFVWGLITIGVFGLITLIILIIYFSFGLPKIESLADYKPFIPSKILAKDGTVLAKLGQENREIVYFEEIPQTIINAFLAAEDNNFFEHHGIDYKGIMRAMYANLKAGRVVQGGSTITQQVAKSLLKDRRRSMARKIKEYLLAPKIEEKFTKEEILFLYLNQIYLGGGYYGTKMAFRGYFGKELSEATIAESAILAGLPVRPAKYSPYKNPERAKNRQSYVLNRMHVTGKIDEKEYHKALDEKIKYKVKKKTAFKAGYFTDWIRQRMVKIVGEEKLLSDGYHVQTTLNWKLQQIAEKEVLKGAKKIDKRQGFKGPLGHIDTDEEIAQYEMDFRKETYRKESDYFIITDDYKREYQIKFDEKYFKDLKEERKVHTLTKKFPWIQAGNKRRDPLLSHIKKGQFYEAVVIKINPRARMIFVSIGGLVGIIPFDNFKWARERSIEAKRQFYPPLSNPAKILQQGDIVLVGIEKINVGIISHLFGDYVARLKQVNVYQQARQERYLLCLLDQYPDVQAALMAISPKNFEVISMVGGTNFSRSQFNRAIQSKRQPGSSFKPILYAAALENGFTPSTIIIDSPEALGGVDEFLNWKPSNYDGKFAGPTTFRNALEQSRNIPTIKIAEKVGVDTIIDFAKRIKLNAKLERNLSVALGSLGITLRDLITSYSLFPNGGKKIELKSILSITDRNGQLVSLQKEEEQEKDEGLFDSDEEKSEEEEPNPFHQHLNDVQVYDKRLAYIMANLLRGVILHGTGRKAKQVGLYLGGKTGTTSNYVDAWFIGFSANLVAGVWTGLDNNKTMGYGETGDKAALPIWMEYMRAGIKQYGIYDFSAPLGIINVQVDKKTGKLAEGDNSNFFMEAFVEGMEPNTETETTAMFGEEGKQTEEPEDMLEDDEFYDSE